MEMEGQPDSEARFIILGTTVTSNGAGGEARVELHRDRVSPAREAAGGDRGQDAHGKTRACSEVHVRLPLIDPCASARDMCTCVHSPS
ncbi:hypothetical protein FFA01_22890 [Frigoribacterium faeni]|uniref:Uncharacterized protein n=1 Tax=Frigoribacterium faeni TaxID=145483 RepID=A0ABQ0USQ7_9MICO|nr:hypothetical protein GCM10025699_43090 [Microbacterium flavescens]GEK83980.1 hypothetical protein FFA01_22890 [Frigoribacterium faeni]